MELGHILAFAAAAIAFIGGGIGSSMAVAKSGQAVAGVVSENPSLYSKLLILQLLPATQGLYGFIIAFMVILKTGILGGTLSVLSAQQGWALIARALPVCIVGFFSALYQGNVACGAIAMVGKKPETSGRAIGMVAVVETYAIFGLLVSFLLIFLGV